MDECEPGCYGSPNDRACGRVCRHQTVVRGRTASRGASERQSSPSEVPVAQKRNASSAPSQSKPLITLWLPLYKSSRYLCVTYKSRFNKDGNPCECELTWCTKKLNIVLTIVLQNEFRMIVFPLRSVFISEFHRNFFQSTTCYACSRELNARKWFRTSVTENLWILMCATDQSDSYLTTGYGLKF